MFEQLLVVLSGHQVEPLWSRHFAFVSGHGFSRAVENEKRIGFQPVPGRILPEILCPERILGRKKVRTKERV
jgi:hypothetical protein